MHALLLAFPFPLFLGALVSDIAYWRTYQIQWSNFSQWLIAGGLMVGGLALLWALVNLFRGGTGRNRRPIIYFVLLLATWAVGLVNALVHSADAWATMPEGLWLSVVATLLALAAFWVGHSGSSSEEIG
ncbi:DUF2231 domain-containing protein [uncultured Paracoccus sp.]|uniref:DUF2231 domain-containing protein n=1 Tax=uncultured Paracoccus sp. TaxID=189685 RepID=UPI002631B291|nr:DUF2231 domain-containing protein [uncultured Paracoccus sp.]